MSHRQSWAAAAVVPLSLPLFDEKSSGAAAAGIKKGSGASAAATARENSERCRYSLPLL